MLALMYLTLEHQIPEDIHIYRYKWFRTKFVRFRQWQHGLSGNCHMNEWMNEWWWSWWSWWGGGWGGGEARGVDWC